MEQSFGPMQRSIYDRLRAAFDPVFLTVENESHTHNVPPGSESHFRVVIATEEFNGKRLIQRHKGINSLLNEELGQIHALALHTYTPEEWQSRGANAPSSPHCLGGELKASI